MPVYFKKLNILNKNKVVLVEAIYENYSSKL